MKLCFKVPFISYLIGPSVESLNLQTSFQEDEYLVKVVIEGDKPLELKDSLPEEKYFRRTSSLLFEIKLQDITPVSLEKFRLLVKEKAKRLNLFSMLISIVNRTFRNIRNLGTVVHLHEIHPENNEVESYLRSWEVKFSENDKEYQSVLPELELGGLSSLTRISAPAQETPIIYSNNWPDIEEAIQDKAEPPPEQEFLTNTIEFLRIRNFRMALLEVVICLEIVLTQYLREFLSIRKHIPLSRINKKFLTSQLGLSTRLAGLLDLTLTGNDLDKINIQKIIKTVEWRNHIVHKTGHLPSDIKDDILNDDIRSILRLVLLLAEKRNQIKAEPILQEIAKKVSENNKIPIPNIWVYGKHHISVAIQFFSSTVPESKILEKVSKDLAEELKIRDQRFDSQRHLFVRFLQFPNKTIARWRHGSLELIQIQKEINAKSSYKQRTN